MLSDKQKDELIKLYDDALDAAKMYTKRRMEIQKKVRK